MLISAFVKAIGQFSDPRIRRILWRSIALSILVFVGVVIFTGVLLRQTALFEITWLETGVDILGGFGVILISLLLFPAAVTAVCGVFLDDVADIVEQTHYPQPSPARSVPIGEAFIAGAKFFAIMILLNLFLLIFLAVPVIFPFVFYGVNGYLIGREYFELVAQRRLSRDDYTKLRKRERLSIFIPSVVLVFLLTIPVINLLVPIFATTIMVHIFYKVSQKS